ESFSIKHINWYDASCDKMRNSPILVQNANGPCPLLALVNALVLSTPHSSSPTALVEMLRTRETISLSLLLEAVFDQLVSGNRTQNLPEVDELYAFLKRLHTGMNVNPSFITPGQFDETKEMRLHKTFNIPLIHAWVPSATSPAFFAFQRTAPTFEDAQNIQFQEPLLEEKRLAGGLTPDEQQTLSDIQTIKYFLTTWPTQLTEYGLTWLGKTLKPGQFANLFRNDHFSTLYKEPKRGALMTLVTDAGYSSHDEIVWESLVDVNGSASELFSGDF
ncbi:hypothetical protein K470DRAFT_199492, partial [Piedraia hortae CBS 480.64]